MQCLGSWKNPPPGSLVSEEDADGEHQLGQKVTDLHDATARENFRVVIIKPEEVEQLDLNDPSKARRWKYTFAAGKGPSGERTGEWKKQELWP